MSNDKDLFLTSEPMSLEWRMTVALSATQIFVAGGPAEFAKNIFPITGTSRSTGEPDIGSGLVVNETHIIANAHVVDGINPGSDI